jgi:D-psicose/D-tagatose/L-ribulose 3-epimerase
MAERTPPRKNPIGANTWIWASPLTDQRLAGLAPRIRAWGFDLVEVPVENPGDWDPVRAADLLADLGLGATVCAVMPPERDLVVADRGTVAATQAYLRACIDAAATVGSPVVGGPIYSAVGRTWLMDAGERRATVARLVEALRPVVEYAGERGVRLAMEPLNRFETSFVNTVEQALEIVGAVGSTACGLLLDTFHMNIEEKDLAAAIRSAGPHLAHFHACGNDRGAPGADHLDWPAIAVALAAIDYRGPVCIESFTPENRTIARAAAIWRPLAPSPDALATAGLAFLRRIFG